jgi:hypothetical protein
MGAKAKRSKQKVILQFNENLSDSNTDRGKYAATLQRAGETSKFFFNAPALKSRIENLNIVEADKKERQGFNGLRLAALKDLTGSEIQKQKKSID